MRRCCAPTGLCTGVVQCPLTLNAATWHNRQTSARFPDLETSNYGAPKSPVTYRSAVRVRVRGASCRT